jgi:hypothetical protein
MQSVGDAAVFRLGPFPAGKQVALTALTVASPTMAGFAPNPHAKDVIFYTVPAAPSRVGDPTCSPYASGEKLLTFVTVRANDTAHASYTQPLMAPVDPPQTPWCLIAQAINGWVYVTAIGYIKQP